MTLVCHSKPEKEGKNGEQKREQERERERQTEREREAALYYTLSTEAFLGGGDGEAETSCSPTFEFSLRILVHLVIYDSVKVSFEHLLLSW